MKREKSAENHLYVVEGMKFDRGYISPYFVTDSEKMFVEYENCNVIDVNERFFLCFVFCVLLLFFTAPLMKIE